MIEQRYADLFAVGAQVGISNGSRVEEGRVVEMRLALFPVSEGKQNIPAAELTADAVVSNGRAGGDPFFDDFPFFGRQQVKRVHLRSNPL